MPTRCLGKVIFADTEGTGLSPHGPWRPVSYQFGATKNLRTEIRSTAPSRAFAFSFADLDGNTEYYRFDVSRKNRDVNYGRLNPKMKRISQILDNPTITKVLHNPRYDLLMYHYAGLRVRGPVIDTQILAHVATRGSEFSYMLKPLAKKYADYPDTDEKELKKEVQKARRIAKLQGWAYATEEFAGNSPADADMWMVDDTLVEPYATNDVLRCCLLYHLWYDEVQADPNMRSILEREHQLMWALKKMEDRGVRVYPKTVRELRTFYQDYQKKQTTIAVANGGGNLNFKSTPQMAAVFYEQRGHTPIYGKGWNKKANRYNYSLNGEQLLKMATGYPEFRTIVVKAWEKTRRRWIQVKKQVVVDVPPDVLAKSVLEFKAAGQTISTFLDVYERLWVEEAPDVWVLHPGFKQTGTITGRLSCANPNMQQVASETTGRRKADIQSRPREAFGPRPGHLWYLPDYSQIEVWLFAFLSGEVKMQEALLSGQDFHGNIAKQVFGARKDFALHKDYYRKCAKLIMFAKLYGGGLAKLALLLKMPVRDAKEFIEQYEAELPGVRRFMQRMINRAQRDGMIFNVFGRGYSFEPTFAYKSVNYLIQGTAADVMKNAIIRINQILETKWKDGPRLLLTIHDEVLIEVPKHLHCQELMKDIIEAMQGDMDILGLPVPLPVEMKIVTSKHRWNKTTKLHDDINRAIGSFVKAA